MSDASRLAAARWSSRISKQAVLIAVRRIGPASPDALAAELAATRSAVLPRLWALEAVRLVALSSSVTASDAVGIATTSTRMPKSLLPSNSAAQRLGCSSRCRPWQTRRSWRPSSPSVVAVRPPYPRPVHRTRPRSGIAARPSPPAGRHPERAGRPVRLRRDSGIAGRIRRRRPLAPSMTWRASTRRPAPQSWSSAARCWGPRPCARRTSPPASGPAHTASSPRCAPRLARAPRVGSAARHQPSHDDAAEPPRAAADVAEEPQGRDLSDQAHRAPRWR